MQEMDLRSNLTALLASHYRGCGWTVTQAGDGTVRARGLGGVTWIGRPVLREDLDDPAFPDELRALSNERMPSGELCPLELLPGADCAAALQEMLDELRLSGRGHVEVYSIAAAA